MQKTKWTKREALREIAEETKKFGVPKWNEERGQALYSDKDIDPGIKDTVFDIRKLGFKTIGSCQGGNGHCTSYPWVEISEKNAVKVKSLVNKLNAQGLYTKVRKEKGFHTAGYPYWRIAISKKPIKQAKL